MEQIDFKLKSNTSMPYMDKRAIFAIGVMSCQKLIRGIIHGMRLANSCATTCIPFTLYYIVSLTLETMAVMIIYIFYSIHQRLVILTAKIKRDGDDKDVVLFNHLYKSIADIAEKYKSAYDPVCFVTIIGIVPCTMVAFYWMLVELTGIQTSDAIITAVSRIVPISVSLGLMVLPAMFAGMVSSQVKQLEVALHNKFVRDKNERVKDWLFMTSPWPLVCIIAVYLTLVKVVLPCYMKGRRPRDLKTVIKWYNVLQIVANAVVTWGIMTSGWTTTYHFGCMLPDYSMKPEPLRMLRFLWWTVVLKLLELFETMFFVLRKKRRQVSFLHVWHHVSTLVMIWSGVKYVGGGITSFSPMLNNAVHVIMYSYYLLSAEGSPRVKAFLAKYKLWLTVLQMVQFTVMLIYSFQVFLPSCPAPHGVATMYFPNVIFVYYMFYDFFKRNYKKRCENGNGVKRQ